jgi:ferrous iron transport protein B
MRLGIIGLSQSGKTTVFNALTGAHQHVGNWPGKRSKRKKASTATATWW